MIGNEWDNVLEEEFKKDYFIKIKMLDNVITKKMIITKQLCW